ncbi:MAG TPA: hypothetical protein VIO64_04525 [Pseudobacteroides sp.]|uniref:hypothetical protein n=1 Tax=Pseudobacteroides sp. TaxID=1968840 RepID=UPI002F93FBFD
MNTNKDIKSLIFENLLWVLFGALGFACFLVIWFVMPHKQQIDSIWHVVFKITSFMFLILSISYFPNKSKKAYLLLLLPLLGYTAYLGPRISYYGFLEMPKATETTFSEYYTLLYLLLYPAIIMSVCFAYRVGGGTPGNCFKIGASGVIILFSGFLDLMWYLVNPVGIPEVIQYAHHIKVIIGHYPTYFEGIIFCLCHIPLMLLLLYLPVDSWFARLFTPKNETVSRGVSLGSD